jgi:antitoxin (DNA-binding transcriptional repressor) of toxin-antitoxin stability system
LLVTKDGEPVVRIVPVQPRSSKSKSLEGMRAEGVKIFGDIVEPMVDGVSLEERRRRPLEELRGSVKILGDIVEPLDDEWDVMK